MKGKTTSHLPPLSLPFLLSAGPLDWTGLGLGLGLDWTELEWSGVDWAGPGPLEEAKASERVKGTKKALQKEDSAYVLVPSRFLFLLLLLFNSFL